MEKRMKSEFHGEKGIPLVTLEISSQETEEKDDYDNSLTGEKRKRKEKGEESRSGIKEWCHLCKRSDDTKCRRRMVSCCKCSSFCYCNRCITEWYPGKSEEAFVKACTVYRLNCNCIACLRLEGGLASHFFNEEVKCSDEEKLDNAKHVVRALLPALIHINIEQMVEKKIECQTQGLLGSDIKIQQAKYEKNKRIFCNCCGACIVDYHRSCSTCSYQLCLTCCNEVRNGNLQADISEWRTQGEGCSKTSAYTGVDEMELSDPTTLAWKPDEKGIIPCPPEDFGGCSKGTLGLKCIFSESWIRHLLIRPNIVERKYKLKMCNDSEYSSNSNITDGVFLPKASARENSGDNYVFSPDIGHANLKHFQLHLLRGEPMAVTHVLDSASGLSWDPMVMRRVFRQLNKDADVLNCLNWCQEKMSYCRFFSGYKKGLTDINGRPKLLKLNEWPPFDEKLPRHAAEFYNCLPFKEYTHPQYGCLNRLPGNCCKPHLGPKAYIGYGFPEELGHGDSVTKLHYGVCDTVNILMHSQAVNGKSKRSKEEEGGAVWDVFRRQDVPQLEKYLWKHFTEFMHINGSPLSQVNHPIHDRTFYLSTEHKRRIKEEYGIEPWSFDQKLGEAIFIPAGCPHQIRNLKSFDAVDFVSPENAFRCICLTEEYRKLPRKHVAREDKLEANFVV